MEKGYLQRMERLTVFRVPLAPFGGYLPDCGVRAARDVTYDSIEPESGVFTWLAVLVSELGEELGLMVGDDDVGGVEPVHLVGQHECTLGVCVVGHDKAFGLVRVGLLQVDHRGGLDKFKQL